jgi:hypothetical protein
LLKRHLFLTFNKSIKFKKSNLTLFVVPGLHAFFVVLFFLTFFYFIEITNIFNFEHFPFFNFKN